MYFESHAHYDDKSFNDDRHEVISGLAKAGVGYVVNIGADLSTSADSVKLSEEYDFMYATVGVHPHDVLDLPDDYIKQLESMAKHKKVVAIGEIGLDYFRKDSPRQRQQHVFEEQLELSKKLNLPVVIHARDACEDTFAIVEKSKIKSAIVHCFAGSYEMSKRYVDKGFYIGVGGVVTFKNAKKLVEVVVKTSIDNIVIETDCPYLSPEPFRGKRNDSSNLGLIVQKIAELKGLEAEEVARMTKQNALKFYGIEH